MWKGSNTPNVQRAVHLYSDWQAVMCEGGTFDFYFLFTRPPSLFDGQLTNIHQTPAGL